MKRVLITGATGFIGRNALQPLLRLADEVHAVSRHRLSSEASPEGVYWHEADLLAPGISALITAVEPTHLLHLAWYAEPPGFWTSPQNLRWVDASLRLVQAFAEAGGERAVLAGTCAEYTWKQSTHCVEGITELAPATLYGTAKHATHLALAAYCEIVGVELAWGRIFFTFGPHEHPTRLVSSVAKSLLAGRQAKCSHGEQVRDFLFAPDLAAAFVALLASDVCGPVNMASGSPRTIRDLVETVAAATGSEDLLRLGALPADSSEPRSLTADIARLHQQVGWIPSTPFGEAVRQTVDWWRGK